MSKTNYLPQSIRKFRAWENRFFLVLTPIYSSIGVDPTAFSDLSLERNVWTRVDNAAEDPATATQIALHERRRVMKEYSVKIRAFVAEYLGHNHLVTPELREALGLSLPNPPSPDPGPQKPPRAELSISVPGQVTAHCQGEETSWGMDADAHGYEWRWAILDAPPAEYEELINSEFSTRAHHTMTFAHGQRGRKLYSAFRWESNKGVKGPWTDFFETIIP